MNIFGINKGNNDELINKLKEICQEKGKKKWIMKIIIVKKIY